MKRLGPIVALGVAIIGPAPVGALQQSSSQIAGIWAAELSFGPTTRGELTLRRDGTGWTASIAGFEIAARVASESLLASFPGGESLRLSRPDSTAALHGYWIQPPGVVWGAPYASPVMLRRIAPAVWRGIVAPLEERFALYLLVRRQ